MHDETTQESPRFLRPNGDTVLFSVAHGKEVIVGRVNAAARSVVEATAENKDSAEVWVS